MTLIAVSTILFYLLGAYLEGHNILSSNKPKWLLNSIGIVAITFHAYFLYINIDLPAGQNLTFINVLSQIIWFMVVFLVIAKQFKPLNNLIFMTYFISVVVLLFQLLLPGQNIVNMKSHPFDLIHVLTAMITFSVLTITAIQVLLVNSQEAILRHHNFQLMKLFPPLKTMESFLFQLITISFVLLSFILFSSIIFFPNMFSVTMLNKTIATTITWMIFGVLLLGRYYFGWRGRIVLRFTMLGFFIIFILIYFSA